MSNKYNLFSESDLNTLGGKYIVTIDVTNINKSVNGSFIIGVPFMTGPDPFYVSLYTNNDILESNKINILSTVSALCKRVSYTKFELISVVSVDISNIFLNDYIMYCRECKSLCFGEKASNEICPSCNSENYIYTNNRIEFKDKLYGGIMSMNTNIVKLNGDIMGMKTNITDRICAADVIETKDILKDIQDGIDTIKSHDGSVGEISDGYHTFNELYHHRAILFASLCMTSFKNVAWKSLLHDDPDNNPMYDGMFIVGVETPDGQATYHYDINPYWAMFKDIKELERAPKYDGHTPNDAIERIYKLAMQISKSAVRGKRELV